MNNPFNPEHPERNNNPEKKTEKTLEDLLKEVKHRLDALPQELRIAHRPPTEEASEEVKQYLETELKLPRVKSIANWIFAAHEILERPKIYEGRVGKLNGLNIVALLYPFGKRLKTVCIYPTDGVDPFMVAKAIYWGLVEELPLRIASSDIGKMDVFFELKTLELETLLDPHVLRRFQDSFKESVRADFANEKSAREYAQVRLGRCENELNLANARVEELNASLNKADERASHWQLAAIPGLTLLISGFLLYAVKLVWIW